MSRPSVLPSCAAFAVPIPLSKARNLVVFKLVPRSASKAPFRNHPISPCPPVWRAASDIDPAPPSFPPHIPSDAAAIECTAAKAMLNRMLYTPVSTLLPQPTIFTSHCVSAASGSDFASSTSPLLFLHGFDSNLLEYRYMLPLLDAHPSLEAHFLDLLGWGLTEKPRAPAFTYGPAAKREHLRAFHDDLLDARPLVLGGASVGGAAAIDFALAYPDRVRALVLLDPQACVDKPASSFLQRFPVMAGVGADVLRSRWLRSQAVRLSYLAERLKGEDTLRIGGLHCASDGWKEAAVDFIVGEGYCVSGRLAEVKVPTLVLWGESDRVLPKEDPVRLEREIPDCRLVYVKESGHSPHIEQPEFVIEAIREFLEDVL